jgi:hypothetical protein
MSLIRVGSRVRQKPRLIEGIVTKREIIGEGVTYFVHDEATDHEVPLAEDVLEVLAPPEEQAQAEQQVIRTEDVGSARKVLK